jgi:hypothetical protein
MRTFSVFPSNVFLELVPRAVRAKREKILRLSPRGVFQVPSWDLYHPASSGKPDGATAPGLPVLDSMSDNLKANGAKQRRVFVGVQAGMIKRVAPIRPDAFAIWAGPLLNISTAEDAACRANTSNIERWSSGVR